MNMNFDDEIKTIEEFTRTTISDACILTAEMGTTGLKGGDSGHGGRGYIKFTNDGSVTFQIRVDGEVIDCPDKVEILLFGDAEITTFAKAFTFLSENFKGKVS